MSPPNPKAIQAQRLLESGRLQEAEALLLGALKSAPTDSGALRVLSLLMYQRRRFFEASQLAQDAVRHAPDDPAAHANLARILGLLGRSEPAITALERALALNPADTEVRAQLANRLTFAHRCDDAAALCRAGLESAFDDGELLLALGRALLNSAAAVEAVEVLRRAAARHPRRTDILEALAFSANYAPGLDPADVRRFHEQHAAALRATLKPLALPAPKVDADPDRRLRVGLLSPDLWSHAVGRFIEPLLMAFDRERLDVLCYHTDPTEDDATARFERLATGFRRVAAMGAREIVRQVREDRIDVLVDLAGLTASHRLAVMLYRAAPVQATYLGYPNTTGAAEVGFRIVDAHTDPAPSADAWCTETLARMEGCFLCFRPASSAPGTERAAGSAITFGSFNDLKKLSDPLLAMWAGILGAVPDSRLIIKTMPFAQAQARDSVARRLAGLGVSPDRVELRGPVADPGAHLAAYADIDVALDSFPYHGTTTTCEALHMGVPVVTLAPPEGVHASRVGSSLLHAVGLADLVASSESEYVRLAAALAGDAPRRAELRRTLRGTLAVSPLGDAVGYARRFEALVRGMWRAHLEDRPRGRGRR